MGPPADDSTRALHRAAALGATPGAVLALGEGRNGAGVTGDGQGIPLLAGRGMVQGRPAAYVCRNFTCRLPVTSADELLATLGR